MKLVRNTGNDRVIDLIRASLSPGSHLDAATPALSLFAPQMGELDFRGFLNPAASLQQHGLATVRRL